jgi:predicted hotdog family 3-hydroxylacyl-ACP dehydratase
VSGFPPVRELVPQRPPMLLLDAVIAWDGATRSTCTATVARRLAAGRRRGMPAAALLEVMAQAVAALHGLRGRARGEPVRVGLLTGCRGCGCTPDGSRGHGAASCARARWSDHGRGGGVRVPR